MADLDTLRHSAAHIMASAVLEYFPEAKLAIGPPIEDGFYYDFDLPRPLTQEDMGKIEARMREIVAADLPFVRSEIAKERARDFFAQRGQTYKVELIDGIPNSTVSFYQHGDFIDLCQGPHVSSTSQVRAFRLLSVAGAYWRGDEHNPMLQRIYGTAFSTEEELEQYLERLAEAAKRDHRRLGRELDLFSIEDQVGPGLILWHPKGALVRKIIEDLWREEHLQRGYQFVYTPHIGRLDLWKTSGHWEWYQEYMYSPMEVEGQQYLLKPMNCPFHILIYQSRVRSYRDLPLRFAELGTVYRYERSGVLHGALRVRGFTQDDAHLFCQPDQLEAELVAVLDMAEYMMSTFGYRDYDIELSVRDPLNKAKYAGQEEAWQQAEAALAYALESTGRRYARMEGEAKFYGPAIDIKLRDAIGRSWQGPTIQVDFNLPERFDLHFAGADGAEHRPVMIHRALFGSMERFVGGLVEHYAGAFPPWLAPVQAIILPIADRHISYAEEVANQLKAAGLRAEVDARRERMNAKIRDAQLQKVPYMLVVGDREAADGTVSLRLRTEENLGPRPVAEVAEMIREAVAQRWLGLTKPATPH
ncbi:MAG: threonine--tRNA ligase [Chloroflexi bacterium]|nr:threonine--tRNA ligase [Chloroflexota bacterium]